MCITCRHGFSRTGHFDWNCFMDPKLMSTPMLFSYSSCIAVSFLSWIGAPYIVGQSEVVSLVTGASDLKGPMLFAFLLIVLVLWFLRGQTSAFTDALQDTAKSNSESQEKTAQTNKEALQQVSIGLATFKTELNTDIDGIKLKQDEHTKELGLHRSEITKLSERIPSTCKIKDPK